MFNEVDKYLLDRWDDVAKFEDAVKKLKRNYQELINMTVSKIKDECKEWSEDEFIVRPYPEIKEARQIWVYKKSWILGKEKDWDLVGLGIQAIDIDSIMGYGEDKPFAGIWTEMVKKKGVDLKKFNDYLLREIKDIKGNMPLSLQIDEADTYGYWFYFTESQKELLEALKKDKQFIEVLAKQFNTLSDFIDPIDKTLKKYLSK